MSFLSWLASRFARSLRSASRKRVPARRHTFRPTLEALEDRWVPSTLTVTTTADSGPGSLRYEVGAAHNGDVINYNIPKSDPGYNSSTGAWTITLTSGELLIKHNLTITGLGADQLTVSGGGTSRVFEIAKGTSTVSLSGLTISNGNAVSSGRYITVDSYGGGLLNNSGASLTITSCTVSGNNSQAGGGGIANYGVLNVNNSILSGNTAQGLGGGIDNEVGDGDDQQQ